MLRIQILHSDQFFVEEAVLLQEYAALFIVWVIHVVDDVLPLLRFRFFQAQLFDQCMIVCGILCFDLAQRFQRVFHRPDRDPVRIPVVVDVVLVFVRSGYAEHHVFALRLREVHALLPEAGDFHEHLEAIFAQVGFIACIIYVVKNRVSDRPVPMDFFERDFPLVVAFLAVHRDHRVKRTFGKAQLASVLLGFLQVFIAVDQQIAGDVGLGRAEVERQAICFRIPVGAATVFFPGEALRSDVQTVVLAAVGLVQLENIKADRLLRRFVAVDDDVAHFPFLCPGFGLLAFQRIEPGLLRRAERLRSGLHQIAQSVIARGHIRYIFEQRNRFVRRSGNGNFGGDEFLLFVERGSQLQAFPALLHIKRHDRCHVEVEFLRFHGQVGEVGTGGFLHLQPEFLLIVGVLILHIPIEIRRKTKLTTEIQRRHGITDRPDFMAYDADETHGFHCQFFAVLHDGGKTAGESTFLHVELADEILDLTLGQIQRHAVHEHADADPVGAVEHFGEVFGIAIFPPAHSRFVRIIHAGHIAALQGRTAVLLLEVCTLAHISVANAENAFRNFMIRRIKGFLQDGPRIHF
ncbi:hypothetical protein D3C74_290110 [compost metagenome]